MQGVPVLETQLTVTMISEAVMRFSVDKQCKKEIRDAESEKGDMYKGEKGDMRVEWRYERDNRKPI